MRCAGSGQARGNDFGYWLLWSWWGLNLQILRRWLAGCDLLEISCRLGIQVVVSSECDASGAKVKAGLLCRRSSQSSQCSPSVGLITLPISCSASGSIFVLTVNSGLPSSLGSGKGHFRPKCFLFNGEDTPRCCALSEHQTRQFFLVILLPFLLF